MVGVRVRAALYRLLARRWFARYGPGLAAELLRRAEHVPAFRSRRDAESAVFAEEAVGIYRRLVAARPGTHDRHLARALTAVAASLAAAGRPETALAAADEAIDLYGRGSDLIIDDVMGLARACNRRALCLAEVGRVDEAVRSSEEAVTLYRRCPGGVSTTVAWEFADALDSLAACLGQAGRHEEAVVAAEEAVGRYADLTRRERRRRLIPGTRAQARLARELRLVGRYEEAIGPGRRAADTLETIAVVYPYLLPLRAEVLLNLARCYGRLERFEAGKAAAEKAVVVYRRLATEQPHVYEAALAAALRCLSEQFGGLAAHAERRAALQQEAEIRRRLAAAGAEPARLVLIDTLSDLAIACEADHDPDAALAWLREAMTVARAQAQDDLDYELDLARTVRHFCLVLFRQARHDEEVAARAEALDIYERLVEVRTDCHDEFATALLEQAVAYSSARRHREAVEVWHRVLAVRRALAARGTAGQEPYVASALRWRSTDLAALARYEESLPDVVTATEIFRELAATDPTYLVQAAYSLQLAARQYMRSGQPAQALRTCEELRELAREANQPEVDDLYTETLTQLRQEMPEAIDDEGPQDTTTHPRPAETPDGAH